MELVRAMALIRQYRPSAQVPIGPEIVFRHMHIPVCINYGLCVLGLRDADPGDEGYDCSHGNDSGAERSEEHTSELQSLMRSSYAVFCLKKKTTIHNNKKIEVTDTN